MVCIGHYSLPCLHITLWGTYRRSLSNHHLSPRYRKPSHVSQFHSLFLSFFFFIEVYLTYNKKHNSGLFTLMSFDTCTHCVTAIYKIKHCHCPRTFPHFSFQSISFFPSGDCFLISITMHYFFCTGISFHANGIICICIFFFCGFKYVHVCIFFLHGFKNHLCYVLSGVPSFVLLSSIPSYKYTMICS